jgi:hypothetical protein
MEEEHEQKYVGKFKAGYDPRRMKSGRIKMSLSVKALRKSLKRHFNENICQMLMTNHDSLTDELKQRANKLTSTQLLIHTLVQGLIKKQDLPSLKFLFEIAGIYTPTTSMQIEDRTKVRAHHLFSKETTEEIWNILKNDRELANKLNSIPHDSNNSGAGED